MDYIIAPDSWRIQGAGILFYVHNVLTDMGTNCQHHHTDDFHTGAWLFWALSGMQRDTVNKEHNFHNLVKNYIYLMLSTDTPQLK